MKTPCDASSPLRRRQNKDHHHHHKNDDDYFNRKNNENNFEADDCFDGDRISSRSAQKHLEITHEISKILECDLDRETLAVCISMLQNGVEPESLALVVKELKREAKRLRESRERAIGGGGGGMRWWFKWKESKCVVVYHLVIVESEKERKEDVSRVTIFAKRKRTCYLVEFISI